MPRQSRLDTPGALHHLICRGIDRQKIFTDKDDYSLFLNRLRYSGDITPNLGIHVMPPEYSQAGVKTPIFPGCIVKYFIPYTDSNFYRHLVSFL